MIYITYREYVRARFPENKDFDIHDNCPHNFGFTKQVCDPKFSCEECWNQPYLQVGDKVRILDGKGIPNYASGWVNDMGKLVGKTVRITGLSFYPSTAIFLNGVAIGWTWDWRGVEKVE